MKHMGRRPHYKEVNSNLLSQDQIFDKARFILSSYSLRFNFLNSNKEIPQREREKKYGSLL